jgi:hypothetical protein
MRTLPAAIVMLLAIFATGFSFVAIKESQWNLEQTQFLSVFNFLFVAPLWFVAILLCSRASKRAFIASVAVSLGVAVGLTILQTGLYQAQQVSGRRLRCRNQLKQIGVALQQYEQRYGCFPPAYIPDAKGKPMHSWRVLVLQFIDESVYRDYSFDEPWNGPNNRKLMGPIAKAYHCPADSGKGDNTSYVAVVGPGTAWPGKTSSRMRDMRDGPDKTISVVEVADSGINSMEPRDISFDQMDFHINGRPRGSISSCHSRGPNVIFVDCGVRFLSETLPPETVRALLTTAGGEATPADLTK